MSVQMGDRLWKRYIWDKSDFGMNTRPSYDEEGGWPTIPDHPQLPSVAERLAKAGPDAVAVVASRRGLRMIVKYMDGDRDLMMWNGDDVDALNETDSAIREQIGEATDGV